MHAQLRSHPIRSEDNTFVIRCERMGNHYRLGDNACHVCRRESTFRAVSVAKRTMGGGTDSRNYHVPYRSSERKAAYSAVGLGLTVRYREVVSERAETVVYKCSLLLHPPRRIHGRIRVSSPGLQSHLHATYSYIIGHVLNPY